MQIITPKRWVDISTWEEKPYLFFLAGPIRGGGDWQHDMCLELQKKDKDCVIACPCRWDSTHPLASHFIDGSEDRFERQLNWERYYLSQAGILLNRGCVVFWLPCESTESPHPGPEPYAMDTRGELGEWRWRMRTSRARVVVGAEPGFFGLSQIQRNFIDALGYDFPIYDTLETTANEAHMLAARMDRS